jgi:tryptophanyl-tRNA synthetase
VTGKTRNEIEQNFAGKGYGHLKTELAEAVIAYLEPFQARLKEIDDVQLDRILHTGAEKARNVAKETLKTTFERMGL